MNSPNNWFRSITYNHIIHDRLFHIYYIILCTESPEHVRGDFLSIPVTFVFFVMGFVAGGTGAHPDVEHI